MSRSIDDVARSVRRRVSIAVLAVMAALVSLAALAVAAPAVASGCAGVQTVGSTGWVRSLAPAFPSGSLTTYAVAPRTPTTMLATNGVVIDQSDDFGCHWSSSFTVPLTPTAAYPFSSKTATITSLVIGTSGSMYAVANDVGHPHVLRSSDNGKTWQTADSGIVAADPSATPPLLVVSPNPSYLYLVVHAASGASAGPDVLYESSNGGQSWSQTTPAPSLLQTNPSAPHINDLAINPANPKVVWAATSVGLLVSIDGGSTWSQAPVGGTDAIALVNTYARASRAAGVIAYDATQAVAFQSTDGGATWNTIQTPGVPSSAALVADAGDAAITTDGQVQRLDEGTQRWTSIWSGSPALGQVTADNTNPSFLHACSCGGSPQAIWTYLLPPLSVLPLIDPTVLPPKEPASSNSTSSCMPNAPKAPTTKLWSPSTLNPSSDQLVLSPGQSMKVHYNLALSPEEMDVFFLAGTGPKSEFSYCPFKWGSLATVAQLQQVRNLRVGLGDFGDYPDNTDLAAVDVSSDPNATNPFVYRLDQALSVPSQLFNNTVEQLSTYEEGSGQRANGDQANYAAILQAATGVGQPNPALLQPPYINPGLQANFGGDSFNVFMHVAGNWFNSPGRTAGYAGPGYDEALTAALGHQIHQAGIWVNNLYNKQTVTADQPDGRADLLGFARATHAISPVPIDCQGQGVIDVHVGDPLVCTYYSPPEGDYYSHDPVMGQEMTKLLLAFRDLQRVKLRVLAGNGAVEAIRPPDHPNIDLLVPHQLTFDVTYRCGLGQSGETQTVKLGAFGGSKLAAIANTVVSCTGPAPAIHPRIAFIPPPPPPPVTNPVSNPNPGTGPAAEPAPNPAQAPQAQAQSQAQGVVVQQKQQQPQLALARAARTLQLANQDAMVGLPTPQSSSGTTGGVVAGGAVLAIAATCAIRRARALVQPAPAVARRRPRSNLG